jgi:predicted transcriptional regulator
MKREKLKLCISTLEAPAYRGPIKLTRITYKAKMNFNQLKPIMDDLIQKLVEEKKFKKNKITYSATPKARKILSHFKELKENSIHLY